MSIGPTMLMTQTFLGSVETAANPAISSLRGMKKTSSPLFRLRTSTIRSQPGERNCARTSSMSESEYSPSRANS